MLFANVQTFFGRDAQELLEERPDLPRRLGIYPQPPAAVHLVAALLGVAPSAHQHKKIRLGLAVDHVVAAILGMCSLPAREQIPSLSQCGDQGDRPHAAIILSSQEHARIARVDWKR